MMMMTIMMNDVHVDDDDVDEKMTMMSHSSWS